MRIAAPVCELARNDMLEWEALYRVVHARLPAGGHKGRPYGWCIVMAGTPPPVVGAGDIQAQYAENGGRIVGPLYY